RRRLRDGQVGADVAQVVVAAQGQRPLLNPIGAGILARIPGQATAEAIATDHRTARHLVGQGRVTVAVNLGPGVRRHRDWPRRDVGGGRGGAIGGVVAGVGTTDADATDADQFARAHVLVREAGAAVAVAEGVPGLAVIRQRHGRAGGSIIDLI